MAKLSGTYEHIYTLDPALNRDDPAFDHDAWAETGDESKLCIRPGEQPTRWKLRHPTGRLLTRLMDLMPRNVEDFRFEDTFDIVRVSLAGIAWGSAPAPIAWRAVRDGELTVAADEVMDAITEIDRNTDRLKLLAELGGRVLKELTPDPKP